jgi:hypothetical protein
MQYTTHTHTRTHTHTHTHTYIPPFQTDPPPLTYLGADPADLGVCQGDCDADSECPGSGVCVQREDGVPASVPGCSGMFEDNDTDYCSNPTGKLGSVSALSVI